MRYLEAGNIARVLYGRYKGNWYIEKLQAQYIGRMELKLCISLGWTYRSDDFPGIIDNRNGCGQPRHVPRQIKGVLQIQCVCHNCQKLRSRE